MFNPLNAILGLFSRDISIDLGTAYTSVLVRGQGIVINEPSVVAIETKTKKILAIGQEAKEMVGRTPANIVAIRPLRDGVISDFDITERMLHYFIQKVHEKVFLPIPRPRVVVGLPSGVTEVEKRAVHDACISAGAREAYLIEEPMAAAIGAGMPVAEPTASMVVDVGGGTTEVAIISLADIVTSESIRVAGDEMDEAIIQHMKQNYNLLIGEQTAERIKIEIGSAYPLEQELTMEVRGRDVIAGLPRKEVIRSEEIREAVREPIDAIVAAIKVTLERTDPELAADLVDNGMVLAGGGVLLRGLDQVLQEATGLPVRLTEDPITCVAQGTGLFLENLDRMKKYLESTEDVG